MFSEWPNVFVNHQKRACLSGNKSSRPEVFFKKDVLENFAKFTGKYLCLSLFFNKVAGLRPATLLKKRTPFYIEHLWWRLLLRSLLNELLDMDIVFTTLTVSSQCSICIPLGKVRKRKYFWYFQGLKTLNNELKCVNESIFLHYWVL